MGYVSQNHRMGWLGRVTVVICSQHPLIPPAHPAALQRASGCSSSQVLCRFLTLAPQCRAWFCLSHCPAGRKVNGRTASPPTCLFEFLKRALANTWEKKKGEEGKEKPSTHNSCRSKPRRSTKHSDLQSVTNICTWQRVNPCSQNNGHQGRAGLPGAGLCDTQTRRAGGFIYLENSRLQMCSENADPGLLLHLLCWIGT